MYCRYQVLFSWPMVLNVGRFFVEAVGLTAAVARALSDAGISVSYGWDGGVVVSEDAGITPEFTNMETT